MYPTRILFLFGTTGCIAAKSSCCFGPKRESNCLNGSGTQRNTKEKLGRRSKPFWSLSSKYRVVPRVADSISDTFYLSIAKNIDVIPKAFMTLTKFGVRVASVWMYCNVMERNKCNPHRFGLWLNTFPPNKRAYWINVCTTKSTSNIPLLFNSAVEEKIVVRTRLLGNDVEYLYKSPYVLLHMQYFPLIYDHFLNAKNKLFSARMRHSPAF